MNWTARAQQIRSGFTGTWASWWRDAQARVATIAPDVARWRQQLQGTYAQLVTAVQVVAASRVLVDRLPADRRAKHVDAQGVLEEAARRLSALVWVDNDIEAPPGAQGVGAVPLVAVGVGALAVVGLGGLYVAREYIPVFLAQSEAQLQRVKLEHDELRAREDASKDGRTLQRSTLPDHPVAPPPGPDFGKLIGGLVALGGLAVVGAFVLPLVKR